MKQQVPPQQRRVRWRGITDIPIQLFVQTADPSYLVYGSNLLWQNVPTHETSTMMVKFTSIFGQKRSTSNCSIGRRRFQQAHIGT